MDNKNKLEPVVLFFTSYEPSKKPRNAENKPPIIFIHGILATPSCWNKVKNHIADRTGRKVYAIGLRNHRSSGWSDEFSVAHLAADLEHFMATQNIPRAILIAHSLGGRAAMKLASEKPERVEKLVVEDMNCTMDEEQHRTGQQFRSFLKMARDAVEQFPPHLTEAEAQKKLRILFSLVWIKKAGSGTNSRPPNIPLPFHKDKSNKFVWDFNIQAVINSMENAENYQTGLSENSLFLGETLFTSGEHSAIQIFKDKELILKHFPNSKIVCVKNVYHNYHLEKPDEFVNEITKFIGV